LKLTLQDDLDNYSPYLEDPKEVRFYQALMRSIVSETRFPLFKLSVQYSLDLSLYVSNVEAMLSGGSKEKKDLDTGSEGDGVLERIALFE